MKLTSILRWNVIEESLSFMRKNIVVDCGHIAVRHNGQKFLFGSADGISDSTMNSFHLGLQLVRYLRYQGREAVLSICLSDTSRLLGDGSKRALLLHLIENRAWESCLPAEYLQALSDVECKDLVVTLQTRNSNRFAALIKKVKARIQRGATPKELFDELNAVFLSSHRSLFKKPR